MNLELDTLDRTVFEMVRKSVVAAGRLPDWRTIVGADVNEKRLNYKTAKNVMKSGGTDVIEVFGHGGARNRGIRYANTIVIDRVSTAKGTLGAYAIKNLSDTEGDDDFSSDFGGTGSNQFSETRLPHRSYDISYQIRYFSDNIFNLNLMEGLLFNIFNISPYIQILQPNSWDINPQISVLTTVGNTLDLTSPEYLEKIFQVEMMDYWVYDTNIISTYVPLNTINFGILNKFDSSELTNVQINSI